MSVPQAVPEQPAPERVQFTPWFEESFCSVAVKLLAWEVCTEDVGGFTETEMGGGSGVVMVMDDGADLVLSATEVAVRVTVAGLGAVAGAL